MKKTIHKFIYGLPIAFFLGLGVFVTVDIIQPSYFNNLSFYWPYFLAAVTTGYLSIILSASYIETVISKKKAYLLMSVFMAVEALFSLLSIQTYYGDEQIPILKQIAVLCLPLVFSLFYFLKIIDSTTPQVQKNVNKIFEDFDNLESSKPSINKLPEN